MSFWERMRDELKRAMEEGWLVVKEGAKVAAVKTEDMAKIGKLRYQVYGLNRKAEKHLTEIGGRVYDMAKPPWENPLSDQEILRLVEEVKKVEEDIKRIEAEISRLKGREEEGDKE